MKDRKHLDTKEGFHYPSPEPDQEGAVLVQAAEEERAAEERREEKGRKEAGEEREAERHDAAVAMRVSTVIRCRPMAHGGIFSLLTTGRAGCGDRGYMWTECRRSRVETDTLNGESIRTSAPMQLGWRSPDANPAKERVIRIFVLYGRHFPTDEARRLPFEDYVAEIAAKPPSQWSEDQWHVLSSST